MAIWGLAFPTAGKFGGDPYTVYVNVRKGVPDFIAGADVHPSFDYLLTPEGEFIGPPFPSESFDIKVERNALLWEFSCAGPAQRTYDVDGVSIFELRPQLLEEMTSHLVAEASDKFAN